MKTTTTDPSAYYFYGKLQYSLVWALFLSTGTTIFIVMLQEWPVVFRLVSLELVMVIIWLFAMWRRYVFMNQVTAGYICEFVAVRPLRFNRLRKRTSVNPGKSSNAMLAQLMIELCVVDFDLYIIFTDDDKVKHRVKLTREQFEYWYNRGYTYFEPQASTTSEMKVI